MLNAKFERFNWGKSSEINQGSIFILIHYRLKRSTQSISIKIVKLQ